MRSWTLKAFLLFACATVSSVAQASDPAVACSEGSPQYSTSAEEANQGRGEYLAKNYSEALRHFELANQQCPRLKYLLYVGRCESKLGNIERARTVLGRICRATLGVDAPDDKGSKEAQEEACQELAKLPQPQPSSTSSASVAPTPTAPPSAPSSAGGAVPAWKVGTGITGGLALVAGVVGVVMVGIKVSERDNFARLRDQTNASDPRRAEYEQKAYDATDQANVALGVGIGGLVIGATALSIAIFVPAGQPSGSGGANVTRFQASLGGRF